MGDHGNRAARVFPALPRGGRVALGLQTLMGELSVDNPEVCWEMINNTELVIRKASVTFRGSLTALCGVPTRAPLGTGSTAAYCRLGSEVSSL